MSRYLTAMLTCVVILSGVARHKRRCSASAPVRRPTQTKLNDPLKDSVVSAETTLKDQTDVAVTIYNNDLALVRDRRQRKAPSGRTVPQVHGRRREDPA